MQTDESEIDPGPPWLPLLRAVLDPRAMNKGTAPAKAAALAWLTAVERDGPAPSLSFTPGGAAQLLWRSPDRTRSYRIHADGRRTAFIRHDNGVVADQGELRPGDFDALRRGVGVAVGHGREIDTDDYDCEGKR